MGFSTAVATGDGCVDKCGVIHRVFHSLYTGFLGLCTGGGSLCGGFPRGKTAGHSGYGREGKIVKVGG